MAKNTWAAPLCGALLAGRQGDQRNPLGRLDPILVWCAWTKLLCHAAAGSVRILPPTLRRRRDDKALVDDGGHAAVWLQLAADTFSTGAVASALADLYREVATGR